VFQPQILTKAGSTSMRESSCWTASADYLAWQY